MNKSIFLVGVGGQGTILMSKILSQGLLQEGYDVKMSEIHGMSQRGGSVTTQIKFGEKVDSPNIGIGEADILISFEKVEAARFIQFLKKDGTLVVNNSAILPLVVLSGKMAYPNNIMAEIKEKVANTVVIDAASLADKAGTRKSQNIVMLGAFVKAMGLENIDWKKIITDNVKPQFVDVNLKAFELGYNN